MTEIVINKCFGGFGLSHKATMRYAELKGIILYPYIDEISKEVYKERAVVDNPHILIHYSKVPLPENDVKEILNENYFSDRNISRDDPALIQVIRELGDESSGHCAELKIVEIPDDVDWVIDEYDGNESVEEKHRSWG
jgi:hypothetical protein